MNRSQTLKSVIASIEQAVADGQLPVVIFDLDDTLFSTAPRHLRIIHEFAADSADQYPEFVETAARLSLADMRWSATDTMVAAGLDPQDKSLVAFNDYWTQTFFTDFYVSLDLPNPGAVDFTKCCHEAGALLYYLTGRKVSHHGLTTGMEQGTVRALTTRGFPFWKGRCELTLKVNADQPDDEYKNNALTSVRSLQGLVVATFDNEPANANMFQKNFPEAQNFWLETNWDPSDNVVDPGLITLSNFAE